MNTTASAPTTFDKQHNPGDLRVDWTPRAVSPIHAFHPGFQAHGYRPFVFDVATVEEGAKLLKALAGYDAYRTADPSLVGTGGINRWTLDSDERGTPGWESWEDPLTGETDPVAWLEAQEADKAAHPNRVRYTPLGIAADGLAVMARGKNRRCRTLFVRADATRSQELIVEGIRYLRTEEISDEDWAARQHNFRPLPE